MDPWVDTIQQEYKNIVDVVKINLDEEESLAVGRTLKVRTVPTQIYLDPGDIERHRHEGLATQKEMKKTLCDLGFVSCF